MKFLAKAVPPLTLLAAVLPTHGVAELASANPIRKVVTLLQSMQDKVQEEGKKEEVLFDKFMCHCKTSKGTLAESMEAAKAKIEGVGADMEAKIEKKAQLDGDVKDSKAGLSAAKEEVATATELRRKEAAEYASLKSDYETNIAALKKAVSSLKSGAATSSFLQSADAGLVKAYSIERSEMADSSRRELLAFLAGTDSSEYSPQSGEIIGILKQMGDEMEKSLAEATAEESDSLANFESLMASKKKEMASLQEQIEVKMARLGDLGVEVAEAAADLEDTKEALAADQEFQAQLTTGCDTKAKDWEEVKKTRAEELLALAETIKILNDDDALDLFKKALPSPAASSFLQLKATSAGTLARARGLVQKLAASSSRPELDLLSLAMQGKKVGLTKVVGLIDGMVANLVAEQEEDDSKKEYCGTKIDEAEDKKKELELKASDTATLIGELQGTVESVTEAISKLKAGIVALDESVAEATDERKAANAEYKELTSTNNMAKEVLGFAKNRLNKFYNPKLHQPEATSADSQEAKQASFAQGRFQLKRAAPPPPPETFGAYTTKAEESNGVIAMIDLLVKDLVKENTEAEVMEKDAQKDYEKLMQDAGEKRAADAKVITQKESELASTKEALETAQTTKDSTNKELMGADQYLMSLHSECDWLLKYFQTRKDARSAEADSLKEAKAVLSGADYSLLQVSRTLAIRRHPQI